MVFEIQSFMLCPSQKNALFPLEAEENYYIKTDSFLLLKSRFLNPGLLPLTSQQMSDDHPLS